MFSCDLFTTSPSFLDTDKNSKYHKMSGLTPQKFYEEICPIDVTTKVSLINECAHPLSDLSAEALSLACLR